MSERLTEHDIALLRTMADEYDSLGERWKAARPNSQDVANLDASFKSRERVISRAVEGGLFRRILNTLAAAPAGTQEPADARGVKGVYVPCRYCGHTVSNRECSAEESKNCAAMHIPHDAALPSSARAPKPQPPLMDADRGEGGKP